MASKTEDQRLPQHPLPWKIQRVNRASGRWTTTILDRNNHTVARFLRATDAELIMECINQTSTAITRLKQDRDDLVTDIDDFQCSIASALGWPNSNGPFDEQVREQHIQLAEANAIIEKLPMTADKVRVVPGMEVWVPGSQFTKGGGVVGKVVTHDWLPHYLDGPYSVSIFQGEVVVGGGHSVCDCYSIKEAAQESADAK